MVQSQTSMQNGLTTAHPVSSQRTSSQMQKARRCSEQTKTEHTSSAKSSSTTKATWHIPQTVHLTSRSTSSATTVNQSLTMQPTWTWNTAHPTICQQSTTHSVHLNFPPQQQWCSQMKPQPRQTFPLFGAQGHPPHKKLQQAPSQELPISVQTL